MAFFDNRVHSENEEEKSLFSNTIHAARIFTIDNFLSTPILKIPVLYRICVWLIMIRILSIIEFKIREVGAMFLDDFQGTVELLLMLAF